MQLDHSWTNSHDICIPPIRTNHVNKAIFVVPQSFTIVYCILHFCGSFSV